MAMSRNRAARSGTHPREARIPESESPTAEVLGPDLDQGIDEEISADHNKHTSDEDADERNLDDDPEDRRPRRARETGRRQIKKTTEGSSRQQQPKVIDKAAGEEVKDWTKFDIGRSIRILRTGTEAQITRELRKLPLRW